MFVYLLSVIHKKLSTVFKAYKEYSFRTYSCPKMSKKKLLTLLEFFVLKSI